MNTEHLTAIERARLAYELMVRRKREAIRRRRSEERSRTIKLLAVGGILLAGLTGTAIYNGWVPKSSLRSMTWAPRTLEEDNFSETRTGQVRSFVKGNTCQELQFNNDSGAYVGGSLVPCQAEVKRDPVPQPPEAKGARLNSIRDAFTPR
jgi:hypothetical protein